MRLSLKKWIFAVLLLCGATLSACQPGGSGEEPTEGPTPPPAQPPVEVAVDFDLGSAEGTAPESLRGLAGQTVTLPQAPEAPQGQFFAGWSDAERYYYPGESLLLSQDLTLTARWLDQDQGVLLQDCSSRTGWWGSNISYELSSQGDGICVAAVPGSDGCGIFCFSWATPLNLSQYENGGIRFDLWVEDPARVTGYNGRFELSSKMGPDPTAWELKEVAWQPGWNSLEFSFRDAAVRDANLSRINYIRLYLFSDPQKPASLKMDNLYVFGEEIPLHVRYETGYVADEPYVIPEQAACRAGDAVTLPANPFQKSFHTFLGWRDGAGNTYAPGDTVTVTRDTVFTAAWQLQPQVSLSFLLDGGTGEAPALTGYTGTIVYLPGKAPTKEGYRFAGWQIGNRLYGSGDAFCLGNEAINATAQWKPLQDAFTQELAESWQLDDGGLSGTVLSDIGATDATQKWGVWLNNVTFGKVLDFSTAGSYLQADNPKADLSGDFAFSAWIKAPQRTLGDRTVFAYGNPVVPQPDSYTDIRQIDTMDGRGWDYCKLTTKGQKTGKGFYTTSTKSGETLFFIKTFSRQDFSDYMDGGYIHLWIYVENAAGITGGDLEFTSSGSCDKEELSWSVGSLDLKDGWNEIYLPIDKAIRFGGDFRPERFNYVRFYFFTQGQVKLGVDDIYLCHKVPQPEPERIRLYLDSENGYRPTFQLPGSDPIRGKTSLDDGLWHHILVSRQGQQVTLYVDGRENGSGQLSGSPFSGSRLVVGADLNYEKGLDGSIAQVRLYNAARTPEQVTDTVIDPEDDRQHDPRLTLKQGLVFDRRQYLAPRPLEHEGQTVTKNDVINAKNMGFDHVKLLLTPNHLIAPDGSLKTEHMEYITEVVNYVVELDYVCYICIHPETDFKPTYLGKLENFELLCRWYSELAAYIGARWSPDTVGLQLMTEPGAQNTNVDWSWYSDRMYAAVRNILPEHTILTSSDAYGNLERLKLMSPATDDNLIYTFTTYEPYTIGWYFYGEHKNPDSFWKYLRQIPYPVEPGVDYTQAIEYSIGLVPSRMKSAARDALKAYVRGERDNHMVNSYPGTLYNRDWHFARAESLQDWSNANGGNIHMMAVEWGCMQFAGEYLEKGTGCPDAQRYEFIKDMRQSFEAYDIGWSYWSYQEGHTVFLPTVHQYGYSPDPETARTLFDWFLLEDSLGLKPLVSKP